MTKCTNNLLNHGLFFAIFLEKGKSGGAEKSYFETLIYHFL
jgi:hypothetical protein